VGKRGHGRVLQSQAAGAPLRQYPRSALTVESAARRTDLIGPRSDLSKPGHVRRESVLPQPIADLATSRRSDVQIHACPRPSRASAPAPPGEAHLTPFADSTGPDQRRPRRPLGFAASTHSTCSPGLSQRPAYRTLGLTRRWGLTWTSTLALAVLGSTTDAGREGPSPAYHSSSFAWPSTGVGPARPRTWVELHPEGHGRRYRACVAWQYRRRSSSCPNSPSPPMTEGPGRASAYWFRASVKTW